MSSVPAAAVVSWRTRFGLAVFAFVLDAAFVTLFAAMGRSEHERAASLAGLFETAWPFLAGIIIAWVVAFVWRSPLGPVRSGIPVWIGGVALGMLFRSFVGQGTALPFILVATGTLLLFLVGWRTVIAILRRIRRR